MTNEERIVEFHRKMTYERINDNDDYQTDLQKGYKEILASMAIDYSQYRVDISKFLSSLESNDLHSLSYSVSLFFELYNQLIEEGVFKPFDSSIAESEIGDSIVKTMISIIGDGYAKSSQQRMSEDHFDISKLSNNDKKEIVSLIVRKLQEDGKQLNWDKDLIDVTIMQITLFRQILISLNDNELYYYVSGIFFDRLSSSEYYQAGRDIAEETILSSYKDEVPELGYFNSFRFYSNNGNVHSAILYANLSLTSILFKKGPYSEKYVKEIIWQGVKFFRNVRLFPWAKKMYTQIPSNLNFDDYERRSLDHSYFVSLLMIQEPSLPSILLDYLLREREKILLGGINDATPWLVTLYNVKRLYPNADFTPTGLGFFLSVFESIVPTDNIKKYKDVVEGNSDLKAHLKESLIKLNETRNKTDFVYDNENAIRISSRLIEYSFINKDASTFLLSMMLKSDYSILFKSKETHELSALILPDIDIDKFESLYDDKIKFLNELPISLDTSMNWIAFSENKLYQLQLFNGEFSFFQLNNWSYDAYKELLNNDYFFNLSFTESIVDKSGVRLMSPEEFKEEEDAIIENIKTTSLNIDKDARQVFLVKDIEISQFPHNLFLDDKLNLLAKNRPVTNVLSTEWLIQTNTQSKLSKNYSKSIWIPIESGDITLNYLNSNIEDTLNKYSFDVFPNVELLEPLSSDINIICSHGAKNISEVQIIFQADNPTYDLNSVIGKGKVLIFFVCYSGSMKTEFFRNNVNSLIKRFIAQGYEAVIAPFWALEVTIPGYWLPEFLKGMDSGLTISQAMFEANKKVSERYPTPAAWGCLHLYGNPNLKSS
jgi:hypothetical protein